MLLFDHGKCQANAPACSTLEYEPGCCKATAVLVIRFIHELCGFWCRLGSICDLVES